MASVACELLFFLSAPIRIPDQNRNEQSSMWKRS
jgi:hypothetical protein